MNIGPVEQQQQILETKEDDNTTYQYIWDIAKAKLRGKFTAMGVNTEKLERQQINNLTMHLKDLKIRTNKTQINRMREIIKIRK